jgi:DNA-binding NtrC family response regulator
MFAGRTLMFAGRTEGWQGKQKMPARIVVVHDDRQFLEALEGKLRIAGHKPTAFYNSNDAFDALRRAEIVEVLVTRVRFSPGQPHGLALAAAARMTRPSLDVIFTAIPEMAHHVYGEGRVIIMPVDPVVVVQAIEGLLAAHK